MLTSSFCFVKGLNPEQERALWAKGITSWQLARAHQDEIAALFGVSRAGKLIELINAADAAATTGDAAWYKANWPLEEAWRLWKGYATREHIALVDIETTGLTPGYDQITVIGLADGARSRVFVGGKPQPGDDGLDAFCEAIKAYRLIVTFNGHKFDLPFIERHFRDQSFHFELPHLDIMYPARASGLTGGLKDMEKAVGIVRADDIKDMRGLEAIQLWGQWKQGDLKAYQRLTTYCKADCVNLAAFTDAIWRRRWDAVYTPYARHVDFAATKGQQLSIF